MILSEEERGRLEAIVRELLPAGAAMPGLPELEAVYLVAVRWLSHREAAHRRGVTEGTIAHQVSCFASRTQRSTKEMRRELARAWWAAERVASRNLG